MIKQILTSLLFFNSFFAFSQNELIEGYVITEENDTIFGKLKDKDYYRSGKVSLIEGQNHSSYKKKNLKAIITGTDHYIKSDYDFWTKVFFKKIHSGHVNLYRFRNKKFMGIYDADINFGGLRPSFIFFCDDYPSLHNNLPQINRKNIDRLLSQYNHWKESNPGSESYYEKNWHEKKLVTFRVSYLLPGAGIELGLSESITFSNLLKFELGYGTQQGFILNPVIDTQLRYYHNISKRKLQNKRTYRYTGNYLCLVNFYDIDINDILLGFQYGWQRTTGKNWYYNLGLGAGKWIKSDAFAIIHDFDFGFNF